MMKLCQAFSLLSVSRAVGIRAKHSVITSKASQHTCSSSPSGSLAAFVCIIKFFSLNPYYWFLTVFEPFYLFIYLFFLTKECFYFAHIIDKFHCLHSNYFKSSVQNIKMFYLLVYLADVLIRTEDKLHCATAWCPHNFLHCSDHTNVWDVLRCLEKILMKNTVPQNLLLLFLQFT